MPSARRSAVSYTRFSDPKQSAGDSTERQETEYRAFCERHNLTPGKEVFADRGLSGRDGSHRKRGRLGHLIEAAKAGRFDRDTVVVVEAWDRLGRQRPDRQTELVAELLRTGVSIGICRLNDIFCENDFATHKWTTLAVFIQLAFQESQQKAERVAASWERRRQRAQTSGAVLGGSLPAWLRIVNGQFQLIPERAATVRLIFKLAAEGLGHTRIVKSLTEKKVPAFGEHVVRANRSRSQFSGAWTKPYVALLLRDRRVVGELQPMKVDKPAGDLLTNYYPAAITEDDFALARAAQEERLNYDKIGRRNGRRQSKHANVFKSLLTHARDGEGFLLHNKGTGKKPELLLINAVGNGGRADRSYTFPYYVFETAILGLLKEVDPPSVMPDDSGEASRVDVLRAKLANHRRDIASIKKDLEGGYSKGLADVLRVSEASEEATLNELQDEQARVAKPLMQSWREVPSLIDLIHSADDPEEARLNLRPSLRAVVESATLLIVPRKSWRFALVQFTFTGGKRRNWIVVHQTAANRRPGGWFTKTFVELQIEESLSLANPKHVQAVEKTINALDLSVLMMPNASSAATATPKAEAEAKGRKLK